MRLHYADKDAVDHVGYLRERHVDVLMDSRSYNRDQSPWSLAELRGLPAGQAVDRDGLTFRRIPGRDAFALTVR